MSNRDLLGLNIKFKTKVILEEMKKFFRNDNDELIVKNYPKKKQPIIQQPKVKPFDCPSCKKSIWFELDKRWYSQNCDFFINKQASDR